MVSRQETARPLLTPGEVMQLPPTDELVLVSGLPPIRARKARYFEDRRLDGGNPPPPKRDWAEPNVMTAFYHRASQRRWSNLALPVKAPCSCATSRPKRMG